MDRRMSVEISCGFGSFKPNWMQRFANPKGFLVNFSLLAIVQAAYGSYLVGNITTLEKRFLYTSQLTGLILIADNISQLAINPVIGYIGKRVNKAKLMSLGMIMISVSCIITGFPYLFYGTNHLGDILYDKFNRTSIKNDVTQYCKVSIGESCNKDSDSNYTTIWPAYIIIFMASFLNGIGNTVFYTLGIPYIDDNVSKKNAPIYLSVLACIRLLGPASGFLLASICLNLYEDPFYDPGFNAKDPRWIGAWWLGFFVIGILLFFISIPLFFFPKQLKVRKDENVSSEVEKLKTSEDIIASLKRLARNKILVLKTISTSFAWTAMGGYYVSQPKYIESQYGTSASKASLFTGTTTTIALAIGMMSGGILVRIFKPSPRVLTSCMFIVSLFTYVELFAGLFLGCPRHTFHEESNDLSSVNLFTSECNMECSCSQNVFQPVCSEDGKTNYFSPCAAGCHSPIYSINNSDIFTGYQDCNCEGGLSVTSGFCKSDCGNNLWLFLTILSVGKMISSTAFAGHILIDLRCVEEQDKSFMIGITKTLLGIGAQIPAPLLFGAILDSTCLIWGKSDCGTKGNCWLYDSDKMRKYLHITPICLKLVATSVNLLIIYYSNEIKDLYGKEVAGKEEEKVEMKGEAKSVENEESKEPFLNE